MLHTFHPGEKRPAQWAVAHASPYDLVGLASLLDAPHEVGAARQVSTLLDRAITHASLDHVVGLASLRLKLGTVGAAERVTALPSARPRIPKI